MAKIYFFVGYIGSGHRSMAGDLVDLLRTKYAPGTIFAQRLGKDPAIAEYGTTPANATLFEISNIMSRQESAEAWVFDGWQIIENIQSIYNQYKDTATFIFVKAGTPEAQKEFSRGKLRNLTTATLATTVELQLTDMDNFFINNAVTASWNYVTALHIFNSDLTVNTTSTTSMQMISILGSL